MSADRLRFAGIRLFYPVVRPSLFSAVNDPLRCKVNNFFGNHCFLKQKKHIVRHFLATFAHSKQELHGKEEPKPCF